MSLAPSDTSGTVIATNIKAVTRTANNPGLNTGSVAIASLNIKPDPDQGDCDLTTEVKDPEQATVP